MLNLEIPVAFAPLFGPARYKVFYGGRGGAKSWAFADALIVKTSERKLRVLCCREIQASIKESSHNLLRTRIEKLGFGNQFTITDTSITHRNGSEFIFKGLFRNVDQIKSLEGIDICWVEEAHKVVKESWEILLPTIRKDGSEIWISFNPEFEDDETFQRFVVHAPVNAVVRKVNYYDNPYFPQVLRLEMEQDKARDPILYKHKWLGDPKGSGRRVWSAFETQIHIRDVPMEEIAKRGNCYMAMDPHTHYYPFCSWIAILPKNQRMNWPEDFYKHVYAEWPTLGDLGDFYHNVRNKLTYQGTLKQLAAVIQAHDGAEYGIQVIKRFIDTRYAKSAGSWNYSTATEGVVNEFAKPENGSLLFTLPNEKAMGAQRDVIHKDMQFNRFVTRSQFNDPSFSVSPHCKNVIASLTNHRLEEDSEKESEKYKDPSDTLRICYAGFENLRYKDPNGKFELQESSHMFAPAKPKGFW